MHCYLCENSAIGVCRNCYKFYCTTHGDTFCQSCQQKGWSATGNTPLVRAAVMTLAPETTKEKTTESGKKEAEAAPATLVGST